MAEMSIKQALEIVLSLANENVLDADPGDEPAMKEKERQESAINIVYSEFF